MNKLNILLKIRQILQFFSSNEISFGKKVLMALAVCYIFWPVDLIPDVIPVLGWLDDIGVAALALRYIFNQMDKLEEKSQPIQPKTQVDAQDVIIDNDEQ